MRYSIPADVACATVEDGAVVLHMGTKRYFSLNETGAAIWRLLEEDVPLGEIPARVSEQYDVTIDDARVSVEELVAALESSSLLTFEPG
jgi:coenzyme PQQ synthesis protein D (PqqD)